MSMPNSFTSLAFLGGGVMATAILRALLEAKVLAPPQVCVSEIVEVRREALQGLGVRVTADNTEAINGAQIVVVAVKPQDLPGVVEPLRGQLLPAQLLISIAPGFTTARLEELAGEKIPVVRVMPNTPMLVGEGASGFCRGRFAAEVHAEWTRALLSAGGRCVEVPEKLMDAVTGLSGSGPAYACVLIEALADGGVQMGLPRDVALTLAAQTLLGAARLILETGEHPAVWKDRVATPGGTTIAGLAALEEAGVRSGLIRAVEAATRRSRELGG